METKITLGILVDTEEILLWQYRILEKILSEDNSEISLIKREEKSSVNAPAKKFPLFYSLHEKIDRLIFRNNFDYDKEINISSLSDKIKKVPFSLAPDKKIRSQSGGKSVETFLFDVILNFSSGLIPQGMTASSRFGIWSFCIGADTSGSTLSNGYWESVQNLPEIEGSLQVERRGYSERVILYRTSRSIYPNSINVNRNNIYELAPLVISRALKGIRSFGENYLAKQIAKNNSDIKFLNSEKRGIPSSSEALRYLSDVFANFILRKIFYFKSSQWSLLYNINLRHHPFPVDFHDYVGLNSKPDKFWADPFVIKEDGFFYIFIEEFVYKTNKGHISVLKLDEKGTMISCEKIIDQPYHMSYPFVFKIDQKYYMVPETKDNRTIEIYSCTRFPDKWERIGNLMDQVAATDSTLFFYNNKWWLFTSLCEDGKLVNYYNDLFLFYSDDLFSGNWHSHPDNPVATDLKNSRPAGRIFTYNDKIFRPSQDCSGNYGRAFNINQITRLTESDFEEQQVIRVEPGLLRNAVGIHTFNFSDGLTVVDCATRRKRINFNVF